MLMEQSHPTTMPPPTTGPPNLGDVITKADVDTKGTGTYAADYVNWARVAHLLHVHAPGWQFHLLMAADGGHVWRAPNGTAYLIGYFEGPDSQRTPPFPQAVMDNRNAAIQFEKVSARDLTDTHRRCLCTAAAAAFSLAWQLWAKEPVEDPHRAPAATAAPPAPEPPAPEPPAPALVAQAQAAADRAGFTPEGLESWVADVSGGETYLLAQLSAATLQRLVRAGVSSETVSSYNTKTQPQPA
jgi:hypothetical protein